MLHVRFARKAVIKAFYSPVQKILFCRHAAKASFLPDITRPAGPCPRPILFLDVFTQSKIQIVKLQQFKNHLLRRANLAWQNMVKL
jgi:hypothetical protein